MYDDRYGMTISVTVPEDLMAVANGKLTATEKKDNGTTKYRWTVINNQQWRYKRGRLRSLP
jgi:hypothetical protein